MRVARRWWTVGAAALAAAGASLAAAERPARAAAPPDAFADFNGDGYGDLAVGIPRADVGGNGDAGAVAVLYGGAGGLFAGQTWHRDLAGMKGATAVDDHFGWALTAGDFDGDGRDDLAVGTPNADPGGVSQAGLVQVLYGTAAGLSAAGNQVWHRGRPGINGDTALDDQFGVAVSAGDFDGDGRYDLAVGTPNADPGGVAEAGAVQVLYGSAAGLSAAGNQVWHRGRSGINGDAALDDQFGSALTAGDFDGDGRDDLAVGAPFADPGGVSAAGLVQVLYGTGAGLSAAGDQVWHRDQPGVNGTPAAADLFGSAVSAGDFDGDSHDDLAVGAPTADPGGVGEAGLVQVLYGTGAGLSAAGNQVWHRGRSGINGTPTAGDFFGWAVAAGDFDGDGRDDLAAGVPYANPGGVANAGAAQVLHGTGAGLSAAGDQVWHRGRSGISGTPSAGDLFGFALAAGDFDGDGRADLAAGVPDAQVAGISNAGSANVLYGTGSGLSAAGDELWHRDSPALDGGAAAGDQMGWSVAG